MKPEDHSPEEARFYRHMAGADAATTIPRPRHTPRLVRIVSWLLWLLAVVLAIAEINGSLMNGAGLAAFLLALAAILLRADFDPRVEGLWQGSFVVVLLIAGMVVFFGVRERDGAAELSRLIDTPPKTADIRYVAAAEFLAAATVLDVLAGAGQPAQEDRTPPAYRYWMAETDLAPEQVIAFYRAGGASGWEVTAVAERSLSLRKGTGRMVVFVSAGLPAGSRIWYLHQPPE